MLARTLIALVIFATLSIGTANAQQKEGISGFVVLELTGALATNYAKLTGAFEKDQVPDGLVISTSAIIAQHLDGGRVRIEHTHFLMKDGAPTQLFTLTATVDKTEIKTTAIPPATKIYTSPGAEKTGEVPTTTERKTEQPKLKLSDLTGVKLRTWKLESELGE